MSPIGPHPRRSAPGTANIHKSLLDWACLRIHDDPVTHFGDSVIHPRYFYAARISRVLSWHARFLGETSQSILPIREPVHPGYPHQPYRRRLLPKKEYSRIFFLPLSLVTPSHRNLLMIQKPKTFHGGDVFKTMGISSNRSLPPGATMKSTNFFRKTCATLAYGILDFFVEIVLQGG